MTRLATRMAVLCLFAAGHLQCGGAAPAPAEEVSVSSLVEGIDTDEDISTDFTVRCGQSVNVYVPTSETADGVTLSGTKRICRQKLVNKMNKRTRCDEGACGSGSCRPDSDIRSTKYECRRSSSDRYHCRCRPTTVLYRCTSCSD